MINRLPLTVGFARVSQATEDQGNLETQTRQLQDYGVHELVTEIGSGAGSDRLACGTCKPGCMLGIPWWSPPLTASAGGPLMACASSGT